jgi:hypothetical protein
MTRYANFETNPEVMDVVYCIVAGVGEVRKIARVLKQPRPTVSTKLMFIRENKFVTKEKWDYKPSWKQIYKFMISNLKKVMTSGRLRQISPRYSGGKSVQEEKQLDNIVKNLERYVSEDVIKRFVENYSRMFLIKGFASKMSVYAMMELFYSILMEASEDEVKKISPDLLNIKRLLKERSTDSGMLLNCLTDREMERDLKEEAEDVVREAL